ncbi:hypothetical protein ACNKHR_15730 [Shigella flexneri]
MLVLLSKLLAVKSRNKWQMAHKRDYILEVPKGGLGELKRRLLLVMGALIVFRIGSFIPIPGIDAAVLAELLSNSEAP